MSEILDGIGLVSGSLGIIQFFADLIPAPPEANGAIISIKVGNPKGDDPGMGGGITSTYGWDEENRYLGESTGGSISTGDIRDFTIDSFTGGIQAVYVGVSTGDDAVCIAWMTVSQRDGTTGGAWTGDIGSECDQHWYEQVESAGFLDKKKTEKYYPRCTWLDGDHTGDTPSASLKFNIYAYGEKVIDTVDNAKQCKSTLWGKDDAPINGKPAKAKRGLKPRKPWMEDILIVSNITQHSAINMCSSEMSWGPDFISPDGHFCDMGSHTLSPLCSTENIDGCVNVDDEGNALSKRTFVGRKRSVDSLHKAYGKINHWN